MKKEKEQQINIEQKLFNNPENNINIEKAISEALLTSISNFNDSKRIPKRYVKGISLLSAFNPMLESLLERYVKNQIHVSGKGRDEWLKVINSITSAISNVESNDNKKLLKIFNK